MDTGQRREEWGSEQGAAALRARNAAGGSDADSLADLYPPSPGCRLETVVVQRPRCQRCNCLDLRNNGTVAQGDGTQLRYCQCRGCGHTFKVLLL